ncbi:hypothetical protein LY78DRAFT_16002 [Colletotrichum sublineola]|nr:hypothetical protein LY78DRAFT_16002 [Colletotrichum sublineola]
MNKLIRALQAVLGRVWSDASETASLSQPASLPEPSSRDQSVHSRLGSVQCVPRLLSFVRDGFGRKPLTIRWVKDAFLHRHAVLPEVRMTNALSNSTYINRSCCPGSTAVGWTCVADRRRHPLRKGARIGQKTNPLADSVIHVPNPTHSLLFCDDMHMAFMSFAE